MMNLMDTHLSGGVAEQRKEEEWKMKRFKIKEIKYFTL